MPNDTDTTVKPVSDQLAEAKVEQAVAKVKSNMFRNTLIVGGTTLVVGAIVGLFFFLRPAQAVEAVAKAIG